MDEPKSYENAPWRRRLEGAARIDEQRERLLRAAAAVFTREGYAGASAEAIAREAGMSKATFYQRFDNKEDCLINLLQVGLSRALVAISDAARVAEPNVRARQVAGLDACLRLVESEPVVASVITTYAAGAGPKVLAMRDAVLEGYAETMYRQAAAGVAVTGGPQFPSVEDAYGVACAILELIGRQLRTGQPATLRELEPVFHRLLFGAVTEAPAQI